MANIFDVFYRFLLLGCVSFGGPVAHIAYFQISFVQKLKWIDQDAYTKLVALSQFLPGPGSSQVGFAIGLQRAGLCGGLAAFIGFTLPSFCLLYVLALIGPETSTNNLVSGVIYGLKLLAVVVVADACLNMSKTFCQDRLSISLTVFSAFCLLASPSLWMQMLVLVIAACIGAYFGKNSKHKQPVKREYKFGIVSLVLFAAIFVCLPLMSANSQLLRVFADFYYAGSLVFGGGHAVVPLLQQSFGDGLSTDQFLTGYAAAQAVPGPMFSLATYLGASLLPNNQLLGALLATGGIFLPGFLLIFALQGAWQSLTSIPALAGAASGVNAAVVGLLVAALYQPIFVNAVSQPLDMAIVIVGLFALRVLSVPIVYVVFALAVCGVFVQV